MKLIKNIRVLFAKSGTGMNLAHKAVDFIARFGVRPALRSRCQGAVVTEDCHATRHKEGNN